jgi:hypothetical protein
MEKGERRGKKSDSQGSFVYHKETRRRGVRKLLATGTHLLGRGLSLLLLLLLGRGRRSGGSGGNSLTVLGLLLLRELLLLVLAETSNVGGGNSRVIGGGLLSNALLRAVRGIRGEWRDQSRTKGRGEANEEGVVVAKEEEGVKG